MDWILTSSFDFETTIIPILPKLCTSLPHLSTSLSFISCNCLCNSLFIFISCNLSYLAFPLFKFFSFPFYNNLSGLTAEHWLYTKMYITISIMDIRKTTFLLDYSILHYPHVSQKLGMSFLCYSILSQVLIYTNLFFYICFHKYCMKACPCLARVLVLVTYCIMILLFLNSLVFSW